MLILELNSQNSEWKTAKKNLPQCPTLGHCADVVNLQHCFCDGQSDYVFAGAALSELFMFRWNVVLCVLLKS